jgi:SAM-dependent methyltransferase
MTDAVPDQAQQYVFDGSGEDLERLLRIAEGMADSTRTALLRSGIGPGWNVIECGCGPVGALTVLSGLVGEAGRVTGVDLNPDAVRHARSVAAGLGLENVRAVAGDVHDLDAAALGGPFDLAFTRLFLVHQPDAARTLRQVAAMLRPGGWLIAQEPLYDPAPVSRPSHDSLAPAWHMMLDLIEGISGSPGSAEPLPRLAADAGLEVVRVDGSFTVSNPQEYFPGFAGTLDVMRERSVAAGLVTVAEIEALTGPLNAAAGGDYDWVAGPFFLDLTLRKPA